MRRFSAELLLGGPMTIEVIVSWVEFRWWVRWSWDERKVSEQSINLVWMVSHVCKALK